MIDPDFIACAPVEDCPLPIPGSRHATCSACARTVILSPSGVQILREHEVAVLCLACAMAKANLLDFRMTAAQLAEVRAFYEALR